MGLSASKQAGGKVCIECDRKTQKELPLDDSSSASKGMLCEEIYTRVGRLGKGRASWSCVEYHTVKLWMRYERVIDVWK
jgi:hypothetical protein